MELTIKKGKPLWDREIESPFIDQFIDFSIESPTLWIQHLSAAAFQHQIKNQGYLFIGCHADPVEDHIHQEGGGTCMQAISNVEGISPNVFIINLAHLTQTTKTKLTGIKSIMDCICFTLDLNRVKSVA